MKVLIFYATYGGGHLSVANAMKEVIEKEYPQIEVEEIDCMKYLSKAISEITVKGYEEISKKIPRMWGRIYKVSRKEPIVGVSSSINKIFTYKLCRLIKKIKPDIIISTHPFPTQMCGSLKKHNKINIPVATILTDFKYHEQWLVKHKYLEKYFVSNEKMKESLIQYGVKAEKIFVTGIPISQRFLEKFDKTKIFREIGLKENVKTVLFFAGGRMGLARHNITTFMEVLSNKIDNIQVIAISGKNPKVYDKFKDIAKYNDNVKVLEFTDKVPELMNISDLVITKPGGVTVSESLASKLPIIAINPIPGQEEENAQFLVENKLAVWIKREDNIEESLIKIINDDEKLKELKSNTLLFGKPNAAKDICNIIFNQ